MRRAPLFTIYAILATLLWFPVLLWPDLFTAGVGMAYLVIARGIFIPMYVVQHVISLLLGLMFEPGTLTQGSTWVLGILAFVAADWLRLRGR